LAEKILQFRNQIEGVEGQIAAKKAQLCYIETDLENTSQLNAKGLARQSQVLELQGNQSETLGQISSLQAQMAGILNSIRDAELETLQIERQFKEQVVTDLREVTTTSEELMLEIVTTQKQLERVDIRAPSEGVVHEMQVTTAGGVVPPGGTIVQIVPLFEGVAFEVRLAPQSIDAVHVGQSAEAVFPAFDQRTTPRLAARVARISPTSIEDPVTRQSYFRVELQIKTEELARLNGQRLVPGMPVEAFLETGERSVLNYITRPLVTQLRRAFREK
jgi:HlyD family secretion protein